MSAMSTTRASCANGSVGCHAPSGRCFFPTTMRASSIGRPMKRTKPALARIRDRNLTSRAVPCERAALLQGIATCGHCGRRLRTHYRGTNATPGYHCAGKHIVEGRGVYCLSVGGVQIDQAVSRALLEAIQPAAIDAALAAAEQLEADGDAALAQWRREVERKRYRAQRAERRYRAVDPDNRLVARGLEAEWEQCLRDLAQAEAELARREQQRRRTVPRSIARRCAHSGPICAASGQRHRRPIAIASIAAQPARGSHYRHRSGQVQSRSHPALARRRDHRPRSRSAALQSANGAHR